MKHRTSDVVADSPLPAAARGRARARIVACMLRACAAAAVVVACRSPDDYTMYARMVNPRAPATDGVSIGMASANARFVANVTGFENPESVLHDADQDVYFVSNMVGFGSVKDGNGYIVRLNAADLNTSTVFVQSGSGGATLDAPKGMAISGDTLWVADIDKLRGFNRVTGVPLATVDFAPSGAVLLNDVAVGANGELRVTDTGIRMDEKGNYVVGPARIFAVGPNAAVRPVAFGPAIGLPNGIAWDAPHRRWVFVSFDPFRWDVKALDTTDSVHTLLARAQQGRLDGVVVLPSGGILYASWADSSVHLLEGERDRLVIRNVIAPAAIGFDTRRNRVAIPMPTIGWVQVWTLPDSTPAR